MPDAMERVQQHAEDVVSDALTAHALRPRQPGRTTCANLDCCDVISTERTALGAQLCIDCLRAEEAQAAHFNAWGRR